MLSAAPLRAVRAALAQTATAAAPAKGASAGGFGIKVRQKPSQIMAWKRSTRITAVAAGILLVAGITAIIVFRHPIQNRIAQAGGRRALANHSAEVLDLTSYYSTPASYFDKIDAFPAWKVVPRGFQTFAGVPLNIDGMICLWGGGNAKMGLNFPEKLTGIAVNRKFQTLYIYHATFFAAGNKVPVYNVVFNYEDGYSVTNAVCYGSDVLDWFGNHGKTVKEPTGPNSRLAWQGMLDPARLKQPLRFCLTAVANPEPQTPVASIDLYSCKTMSAACILAMTTGKPDLMK